MCLHLHCPVSLILHSLRLLSFFVMFFFRTQRNYDLPCAYQPDPPRHPPAAVVPAPRGVLPARWCAPLRRGLRGAVLHHVRPVAAPDLLHLWLLVPGDDCAGRDLRRSVDLALLLPAGERGLPLVVEILPPRRQLCLLYRPVCSVVPPDRAGYERFVPCVAVLRLHEYYLLHVLPRHRHHWLLQLLLV